MASNFLFFIYYLNFVFFLHCVVFFSPGDCWFWVAKCTTAKCEWFPQKDLHNGRGDLYKHWRSYSEDETGKSYSIYIVKHTCNIYPNTYTKNI